MSEKLDLESFLPFVDSGFDCAVGPDHSVRLSLVSATEVSRSARQRQFSVLFRGPGDRFVPQGTYAVSHPEFGSADLFLVPVGVTPEGYQYEAFFNQLLEPAAGGAAG